MKPKVGLLAFAVVLGVVAVALLPAPALAQPEAPGSDSKEQDEAFRGETGIRVPAEAFDLPDLDGKRVRLDDFAGRVLVIGVGMSWCAGCPPEGHELGRLWQEFHKRGVRFVYFNKGETPDTAMDFAKYCRVRFPMLLCPSYRFPRSYQVGNPGIIVVDRSSRIRMRGYFYHAGYGEKMIRAAVSKILAERTPAQPGRAPRKDESPVLQPRVEDNGWTACSLISRKGVSSYQPSVGASAGGIWAAWAENAMTNGEIAVRQYDGRAWRDVRHPVPSKHDDYNPRIVVDSEGKAVLAWVSNRSGKYGIWTSRFDGAKWQQPTLRSAGLGDSFHPSMAVSETGAIWLVWYSWSFKEVGGKPHHWRSIYAAHHDQGGWSNPVELTPYHDICVDHWDPEVAIKRTGEPILCWAKDNRNDPTVFSKSCVRGKWGTGLIVGKAPKPQRQRFVPGRPFDFAPHVAASSGRGAWAFWQSHPQRSGKPWQIKCAAWSGSAWTQSEQVSAGEGQNCRPFAIVRPDGGVLALWMNVRESLAGSDIFYSSRGKGKWQTPRALATRSINVNPVGCVDRSGRAWVVWQSGGGGRWAIYATAEKRSEAAASRP